MTPQEKEFIDNLSYMQLLYGLRFAPLDDVRFLGEHGAYWMSRMSELRNVPGGNDMHVKTSKAIGW